MFKLKPLKTDGVIQTVEIFEKPDLKTIDKNTYADCLDDLFSIRAIIVIFVPITLNVFEAQ